MYLLLFLCMQKGFSKSTEPEINEWIFFSLIFCVSSRENEVDILSETHDLCIGGDCVEMLQQTSAVLKVIPYVKVEKLHIDHTHSLSVIHPLVLILI